jgi:hypothetical protein
MDAMELLDLEYRVFKAHKLIFKRAFSAAMEVDEDELRELAAKAINALWAEFPGICIMDEDVLTQWCAPDEPLPC